MRVGGKRADVEESESNELMSESYSRRSWKGIAIAFLVIGAVAAIVALIVIYSGSQSQGHAPSVFTLSDVINGVYSPKGFGRTQWLSEDEFWYLSDNQLWSYDISKNEKKVIINSSTWDNVPDSFSLSPTGNHILYSFNKSKLFRYSYNAAFHVMDNKGGSIQNISNGALLQLVSWGPGDQLVFVYMNNIYYQSKLDEDPFNVTWDGVPGKMYNGVPDWVYEEEVLGSTSALWWSPSGRYLAFMKFDDSSVDDMYYMEYGSVAQDYPTLVDLKYPKPGKTNPVVSVWVFDTSNNLSLPVQLNESYYVTSVSWSDNETLCVVSGPRTQTISYLSFCSADSAWECQVNSEERSDSGWIDVKTPYISQDGKSYFLIKSAPNGFKHLSQTYKNNGKNVFLTNGSYEVTSIEYYDDQSQTIYYLRTDENMAEKRRFYSLQISNKTSSCLSCDESCNFTSISVGKGGKYYARTCSNPKDVPDVNLLRLATNEIVTTWQNNSDLKQKLGNEVLPRYYDHTISVPENPSLSIKIRVFVPTDFQESRKYPAVINVYGGPGNQKITDAFGIDWGTFLVNVRNYLYVEVDGRGSPYRGDDLLYQMYKKLGTVEIQDQITAMKYLIHNVSYVDPKRTAIWGWSYGGYAAAMALATSDVFKCGMSVAPVTSWNFYDSIYTERYMLTPEDNLPGYNTSQLMHYVSGFKNHSFLLQHGTADDNVHVQQTMILTKALNSANLLFDMHLYPDENHSIPKSVLHVYMTMQDFLDRCFS